MERWGETGRLRRCFARIASPSELETCVVAACLFGFVRWGVEDGVLGMKLTSAGCVGLLRWLRELGVERRSC